MGLYLSSDTQLSLDMKRKSPTAPGSALPGWQPEGGRLLFWVLILVAYNPNPCELCSATALPAWGLPQFMPWPVPLCRVKMKECNHLPSVSADSKARN